MLSDFPELLEECNLKIKGEPVEDDYGNITYPTIDKPILCIPRSSISAFKEVALGYGVDLVLYTEEELLKQNNVFYEDKEYILKRADKKQGHFENYLVMKNV